MQFQKYFQWIWPFKMTMIAKYPNNYKYLLDALTVLFNLMMPNSCSPLMSPILGSYDKQFNVNVIGCQQSKYRMTDYLVV